MSKLKSLYIFLCNLAMYINDNEAFGWFIAIVMIFCLLCNVGVSYAVYDLENDYGKAKTETISSNACVLMKVDSLSEDIKIMNTKLDLVVDFVKR